MKRVLLVSLGLLCVTAVAAFAGNNSGVSAYLSWSPTSNVTDTAASAANNLYVRYVAAVGKTLEFKGGEIDLIWDPPGDGAGCWDHIGTSYKTSSGTTCTYLNRGSAVPVITADDPNHFHVAWANNSTLTGCTAGAGIQVQFETDLCADPAGCVGMTLARTLDGQNNTDDAVIAGPVATVAGGGSHLPACQPVSPVQPTTWGKIKGVFRN